MEAEQKRPFDISKLFVDMSEYLETGAMNVFGKKPEEPRKPTARELSAREVEERKLLRKLHAEVVDDLLDELRDYKALEDTFGDAEYGDRVFAIEAELKKLTDVEK